MYAIRSYYVLQKPVHRRPELGVDRDRSPSGFGLVVQDVEEAVTYLIHLEGAQAFDASPGPHGYADQVREGVVLPGFGCLEEADDVGRGERNPGLRTDLAPVGLRQPELGERLVIALHDLDGDEIGPVAANL